MIAASGQQPEGTTFWVTRRPSFNELSWDFCPPFEEFLAGPFESFDAAAGMIKTVRSWLENISLLAASSQMGVFAIRPALQNKFKPVPLFERDSGACKINEQGTRVTPDWIRQHAAERREPIDKPSATGFGANGC